MQYSTESIVTNLENDFFVNLNWIKIFLKFIIDYKIFYQQA